MNFESKVYVFLIILLWIIYGALFFQLGLMYQRHKLEKAMFPTYCKAK